MPLWFIEPVTYFLVLGVCGTYISFLAGNISNFRLPVSAVAQQVAQVEEGSTEGEIVSTLAIAATQVMITLSALAGAIFVSAIVGVLPATVVAAFDWLLPSIWGALVVQFGLRNWRYAVVAVAAADRRGRLLRAAELEPHADPGRPDGRSGTLHPQAPGRSERDAV